MVLRGLLCGNKRSSSSFSFLKPVEFFLPVFTNFFLCVFLQTSLLFLLQLCRAIYFRFTVLVFKFVVSSSQKISRTFFLQDVVGSYYFFRPCFRAASRFRSRLACIPCSYFPSSSPSPYACVWSQLRMNRVTYVSSSDERIQ